MKNSLQKYKRIRIISGVLLLVTLIEPIVSSYAEGGELVSVPGYVGDVKQDDTGNINLITDEPDRKSQNGITEQGENTGDGPSTGEQGQGTQSGNTNTTSPTKTDDSENNQSGIGNDVIIPGTNAKPNTGGDKWEEKPDTQIPSNGNNSSSTDTTQSGNNQTSQNTSTPSNKQPSNKTGSNLYDNEDSHGVIVKKEDGSVLALMTGKGAYPNDNNNKSNNSKNAELDIRPEDMQSTFEEGDKSRESNYKMTLGSFEKVDAKDILNIKSDKEITKNVFEGMEVNLQDSNRKKIDIKTLRSKSSDIEPKSPLYFISNLDINLPWYIPIPAALAFVFLLSLYRELKIYREISIEELIEGR